LTVLVEACVDSVESALAAEAGGASRVELCDNLVEGGTTPSAGMIAACRSRLSIPIFVLVRPRGGDFLFTADELEVQVRDVAAARERGADGVVIGALRADGTVHREQTAALMAAAGAMSVTFHRAFDVSRDPAESLDALMGLGVARVLTSGQAPSALLGAATLAALVARGAGRIGILAGGGIHEDNVADIVARSGVGEVHVRGTVVVESAMRFRSSRVSMGKAFAPDDYRRTVTDAERIRRIRERLSAA